MNTEPTSPTPAPGLDRRRRLGLTLALVSLLASTANCASSHRPHPRPEPPALGKRTLVIAMDAVPYQALEELIGEPGSDLFDYLPAPVPLISTFPSTTTLAFTGIFEPIGLATPPGYEARFFDRAAGKVRGGGVVSYYRIEFSWRDIFDWKTTSTLGKAWGYVQPIKFSKREIRKSIDAFLASDLDPYFVYIGATDGVAHIKGPRGFERVFQELDAELRAARREHDFFTVVLSDHGFGPLEEKPRPLRNVRGDVESSLRNAGFDLSKRLRDEQDAILVPFGLLSSMVAFAVPEQTEALARALVRPEGVGLCAVPNGDDNGFTVHDSDGYALAEYRSSERGDEWRYRPMTSDPLDYRAWERDWRTAEDWLELTAEHHYPDALHRMARAFDLVTNHASAVCSTAPGFMYGSALTEHSGRITVGPLRWTHGALDADDTLGFFMTDHPALETRTPVPFDEALRGLAPVTSPSPDEQ